MPGSSLRPAGCIRVLCVCVFAFLSSGYSADADFVNPLFTPGKIAVADLDQFGGTGSVILVDLATGAKTVLSSGGLFVDPAGIAMEDDGDLIVSDNVGFGGKGGLIRLMFDPQTGAWTQSALSSGGLFDGPTGIAIDAAGQIIVLNEVGRNDNSRGRILRVDPLTGAQSVVSENGYFAQLSDVDIDANGDLYVTNFWSTSGGPSQVLRVDPVTGAQTLISGEGKFEDPAGITIDADGSLIVTERNYNGSPGAVLRVDRTTGAQTVLSSAGLLVQTQKARRISPTELIVSDDGRIGASSKIVRLTQNPATGAWGQTLVTSGSPLVWAHHFVLSRANQIPIAQAGPDQAVHAGTTASLDGGGSSDPDGHDPLAFSWTISSQPPGSSAALSDPAAEAPSFVPDVPGEYRISLVVTDSLGAASAPDETIIQATNAAPTADAGADQDLLLPGSAVQLNGSGSQDPDGDPVTYSWSLVEAPAGSAAALSAPTSATPGFTADFYGIYRASLTVTDSFGAASAADTVTVVLINHKPIANAGEDRSVTLGGLVLLDGTGSADANQDPLTYSWAFTSLPAGSAATLIDPTSSRPAFTPDLPGVYSLSLTVDDGRLASDPDSVTITVTEAQTAGLDFFTLPSCRLIDTRGPAGEYGAPALADGLIRYFKLSERCGIPSSARAVAVNTTVVAPSGAGYVTIFPGDIAPPSTSQISFSAGRIRANNAILVLAGDGSGLIGVRASVAGAGTVHFLLDVNGYFD